MIDETIRSIKFLGVLIDEHLTWKGHVIVIENKILNIRVLSVEPKSTRHLRIKTIVFLDFT